MLGMLVALLALAQDTPRFPPHYAGQSTKCPVGGETFDAPVLMHYSTFGALPDGQPIGSIEFPRLMPECPGNGLVLYDDFKPETVAKLTPLVANDAYKALRKTETSYYRAHWLAKSLGDQEQAAWLLLTATWQAKNADPDGARARRYNQEFVAAVRALPADPKNFESIVLRARAANALRELGRFDEAEALRATVVIDPDAGGSEGAKNREGWVGYLQKLAEPIARHDAGRTPIDLVSNREAAMRCLASEFARPGDTVAPLSAFEASYCAGPKLAEDIAKIRKYRQ